MDGSQWSLQDAKNSFSAVVEAACRGEPQTVTKRGKRAVVVLSAEDYDRLSGKTTDRRSFVQHLLSFPQGDGDFDIERSDIELRDIEF
jgi:prevent-host-death family protein